MDQAVPVEGCGAGGAGACCGEEQGRVVFVRWFRFRGEEVSGETGEVGDVVAGRRRADEGAGAGGRNGGGAEGAGLRRGEEAFAFLELRLERGVRHVEGVDAFRDIGICCRSWGR